MSAPGDTRWAAPPQLRPFRRTSRWRLLRLRSRKRCRPEQPALSLSKGSEGAELRSKPLARRGLPLRSCVRFDEHHAGDSLGFARENARGCSGAPTSCRSASCRPEQPALSLSKGSEGANLRSRPLARRGLPLGSCVRFDEHHAGDSSGFARENARGCSGAPTPCRSASCRPEQREGEEPRLTTELRPLTAFRATVSAPTLRN